MTSLKNSGMGCRAVILVRFREINILLASIYKIENSSFVDKIIRDFDTTKHSASHYSFWNERSVDG